ncbi:hypothetical protein KC367_g5812 [Hortaea werneckii]|nr:hypothetical protein KC342_g15305 [Hortaea werneckii]KAI7098927.1 hypothetical protein KC339_g8603 [Hortaea werneckii]KAI7236466.1 hypothetical protein KC365_g5153 [Hortaea werneckii]KAI7296135.1 hypothetical protein KC340_g15512 [Hortaea werneckii]KAI7313378.1 hypothetical protein KC315_g11681 [Hortaea werneckii]
MQRKRHKIDVTEDIIHVKCRGSTKLMHVHQSLLKRLVGPFEKLEVTNGEFDPITKTLDLSKLAQHDSFELVVQLLYTGETELVDEPNEPLFAVTMLGNAYYAVFHLMTDWDDQYLTGLLNKFMDHLLDRIINPENYGSALTVEMLLEATKGFCGPPIRFISDWLVHGHLTSKMRPARLVQLVGNRFKDRVLQLFLEQRLAGYDVPPWEKDPCAYHLHFGESKRCQARA